MDELLAILKTLRDEKREFCLLADGAEGVAIVADDEREEETNAEPDERRRTESSQRLPPTLFKSPASPTQPRSLTARNAHLIVFKPRFLLGK